MNFAFIINSLSAGGAERILVTLAEYYAAKGHKVSIITLSDAPAFYKVDSRIQVLSCDGKVSARKGVGKIWALFSLLAVLRKRIKNVAPDRIIAFMDQANILTLMVSGRIPTIVSERIFPAYSSLLEGQGKTTSLVFNTLRNLVYRRAYKLVVLTQASARYFPGSLQSKIVVIPNLVVPPVDETPDYQLPARSIVSMGRLTRQKRFDLLIEAFAQIEKAAADWSVTIFGDGPLHDRLQQLIDSKGLGAKVKLVGLTRTPWASLKQAEIFVLCSDYEGFPGALAQAMSSGRAVIASNCLSGPAEMISSGYNGLLFRCGDISELVQALQLLIEDPHLRNKLGVAAMGIRESFKAEDFFTAWTKLIVD